MSVNYRLVEHLLVVVDTLRRYHRHEVRGLQNVPAHGPALIVANHSLATYDIALLFGAIYHEIARLPRPLIDRLFYKFPYLGDFVEAAGAKKGSPDNARDLLAQGQIVVVAPGGMAEALRPSTERYQIMWDRRVGFARLAFDAQVPVIVAVCPHADDLYDVYSSKITDWAYKKFRIPVFFARGLGFSPLPKPVRLVHFLSEPLRPPRPLADEKARAQQIKRFHRRIVKRTEKLIQEALHFSDDGSRSLAAASSDTERDED